MRFFIALVLVVSTFVPSFGQSISRDDVDKAIEALDRVLARREYYIDVRQAHIDSLKLALKDAEIFEALMALGDAYMSFDNDSSLCYYSLAIDAAVTDSEKFRAKIKHASHLPLAGFSDVAVKEFESCKTSGLDSTLLRLYHRAGRRLYSHLSTTFAERTAEQEKYFAKAIEHQQRYLELLDPDSDEYMFNLGENYLVNHDFTRAEAVLSQLVNKEHVCDHKAVATHHLSYIAKANDDYDAYLYYLAKSATYDALTATLEVRSLQQLGSELYEDGDIDHAYTYLSVALDNAVRCGATLRMIETSRSLPMIARAHSDQMKIWRRSIYIVLIVMLLLLINLCVSLYRRHQEMKRMRELQDDLRTVIQTKDGYISQFLKLCSVYMDKLSQLSKLVERKLSAGKADELLRLAKSGKFIEEQNTEFYEVFDNAFLHLYPDFVSEVNKLLRPDEQIELRPGELLNTPLRILAVLRMGIEDASTVAQILNFSVNTIYSYRNRVKGKAINRDTFEEDVMKINAVV